MSQPSAACSIGDRVRVSERCYDAQLHGATGIVSAAPDGVPDRSGEGILWIEFDPWITAADSAADSANPIEAGQVEADTLDPA
jgi:hypothetical protein